MIKLKMNMLFREYVLFVYFFYDESQISAYLIASFIQYHHKR